jgi:DNA-binding MarR family transcriptional regulator
VVLERRKLLAAAMVDGKPTLLGADAYLRATYLAAVALRSFNASDIADKMGVTVQNANNRLKRLVALGALSRRRTDPSTGGREYSYEVQSVPPE